MWKEFKEMIVEWAEAILSAPKPYTDQSLVIRKAVELAHDYPFTGFGTTYEYFEELKYRAYYLLREEYFKNRYRNRYVRRI